MSKYITQITSTGMLLRIDEVCFEDDNEETNITILRKKSLIAFRLYDGEIEVITTGGKVCKFYAPKAKDPKAAVIFSQDGKKDKSYSGSKIYELLKDLMAVFSNPNQAQTKKVKTND